MIVGDALLLQKQLCQLESPNSRDLEFLQNWMKRPSMGCVYLLGQDSETWEMPDLPDLISLCPRQADGLFSSWVTDSLIHTYHRLFGKHFKVNPSSSLASLIEHSQGLHRSPGARSTRVTRYITRRKDSCG